jgi:hypothetical protein
MAELNTDAARSAARTALGYSQAFDGKGIDWQNGQPWPHRIELAQALDWITELGAMTMNLADRADAAPLTDGRIAAVPELLECVRDLVGQITAFAEQHGEADFETGQATALMQRLGA